MNVRTQTLLWIAQRASAAVLQADAFGPTPALKTNRLDAYYGLERPINPTPWLNFTPVAGGRVTYYTDALGGKDTYTRTIGEVGFDAHLLASGTFDYKNPVWEVDGRIIGPGHPGPVTQQIQEVYFGVVKGQNDRYQDWLTYI